jgi:CRP-like cAMP-binding protein
MANPTLHAMPEKPSKASVIEACTLFNALAPAEREEVRANSFFAYAERGDFITIAGSPIEFIGLIGSGFAKKSRSTSSGQEVAIELLGPGQCFGLLSMIEGQPCQLSSVAVTNCWYLKVPCRILLPILARSSALKDQVIRTVIPRLRRAHEMMTRLSSGRVESRLAAVLFLLAGSYGSREGTATKLSVPLTRQDLSEMAGTTVETTIRIMSRWQKEGVVATDHQEISILDEDRLQEAMHS